MMLRAGDVVRHLGSRSLSAVARVSEDGSRFWSESAGPFHVEEFEKYVPERELVEREASLRTFVCRMRVAVNEIREGLTAIDRALDLLEHPSS